MLRFQLLILLIVFSSCMSHEKLLQRTELQLSTFMEQNRGKWQLEEILQEEGALYTVVHIRQQHYSGILSKKIKEHLKKASNPEIAKEIKSNYYSQINKIDKVQKEIYEFLSSVTTKKDFLYVEGRSYPHHYRDTFLEEYSERTIAEIRQNLEFGSISKQKLRAPYYFLGASVLVHKEQKMNVVGAENLALLNLTLSLYENSKLPLSDLKNILNECHEAREDEMLKNMAVNFDELNYLMNSLRFVVCGSKHEFKNNIEKWNLENPDKKMNFITFTPNSL